MIRGVNVKGRETSTMQQEMRMARAREIGIPYQKIQYANTTEDGKWSLVVMIVVSIYPVLEWNEQDKS